MALLINLKSQYRENKKVTGIIFNKYHYNFSYTNSIDDTEISISSLNLLLEFYFISNCLLGIFRYTSNRPFKVNMPKNKFLIAQPKLATSLSSLTLSTVTVFSTVWAPNLGVILDFPFMPQIQFISNSCLYRVWTISKIWPLLTLSCYYVIQATIIISHLDYCNNVQYGFLAYIFAPLP